MVASGIDAEPLIRDTVDMSTSNSVVTLEAVTKQVTDLVGNGINAVDSGQIAACPRSGVSDSELGGARS
jgi:hypothetical protein